MLNVGQADGSTDVSKHTLVLYGEEKIFSLKRRVINKLGWWLGTLENSVWLQEVAPNAALWAPGPLAYVQPS